MRMGYLMNRILAISIAVAPAPILAAFTYPGCKDAVDTDFKLTVLASKSSAGVEEPMKMAFDLVAASGEDAKGKVDVYFTQRLGLVRKFDSRQIKVLTLGSFNLTIGSSSSDGLMGIALDPGFKSNHMLYLYYTYKSATESSWRVSRFTLDATNEHLDMASEKVVLAIPMKIGSQHPGGALQFDAYGDLWITVGNDYIPGASEYPVWSSANTNDLRGKILRIHPTADGSYTVPAGNLFKPGTAKTRPEIYVMGTRHPYTLTLDPVRRWVTWGDVGPDDKTMDGTPMNQTGATEKTEEDDVFTSPGNAGYPFFAGDNFALKTGIDPNKPVIPANSDWGDSQHGLDTLPPAIAAIHPYRRACAITGPIYRYDGDLVSSIKLPPHFQRKWFVTDFNGRNPIVAVTLSEDGKSQIAQDTLFKNLALDRPLDFQVGPDGALYVVNYAGYRTVTNATGILRIEYAGDCRPNEPKLEKPTGLVRDGSEDRNQSELRFLDASHRTLRIGMNGPFRWEIRTIQGSLERSGNGSDEAVVDINPLQRRGISILVVRNKYRNETAILAP